MKFIIREEGMGQEPYNEDWAIMYSQEDYENPEKGILKTCYGSIIPKLGWFINCGKGQAEQHINGFITDIIYYPSSSPENNDEHIMLSIGEEPKEQRNCVYFDEHSFASLQVDENIKKFVNKNWGK